MVRIFRLLLLFAVTGAVTAEDIDGWLIYDGMYRTFLFHIPPSYNGIDSLPLVINMNGGGREGQAYASMTMTSQKSDVEGFFVLYPSHPSAAPWNAGEWYDSEVDDVGFISYLIDTLLAEYSIDTLRIYATGFSTGALMTHRLACELSTRIAAAAPVAGPLILDACEPERRVPLMHIHARDDHHVPYYGGRGIYEPYFWPSVDSSTGRWVELNQCLVGPDSFTNQEGALRQRWINSDSSCEVVLWTTEDGQHTWPGSPTHDPILGVPSNAISATDEIWEFFRTHPMPVEEPCVSEQPVPSTSFKLHTTEIIADECRVSFSLDTPEYVHILLFDATGRKAGTYFKEAMQGMNFIDMDASGLEAGVYYLIVCTPTLTETARIIVAY